VEALRRRLVNAADAGVSELERARRGKGGVDFERLRQAARAVREIAAIPGPGEPRPPAPGATVNGVRDGGATRGGLAGEILRAHRQRSQPEPAASEERPRVEAPEQPSPAERGADAAGGPAAELANQFAGPSEAFGEELMAEAWARLGRSAGEPPPTTAD
jgi:hypothetical protein